MAERLETVAIDLWQYSKWNYSVYIGWDGHQFIFEGKARENTGMFEWHKSFPSDRSKIEFKDKEELIRFLTIDLPDWGCPSTTLSRLVSQVNGWYG